LPVFFDDLVEPFYSKCPKSVDLFQFGQIFMAPAYYPHQRLDLWRPDNVDQKLGTATNFRIVTAGNDAFRRSAPYNSPQLASNEEFIALKAKKRPVVLIQPADAKLSEIRRGAHGGKIARHLGPVALVYSAENEAGFSKFPKSFLDDVRLLKYPQFMFLPKGGPILRDSLARLDEVQSVTMSNLEATEWALAADVLAVLRSQLSLFLTELSAEEFLNWRSELQKQN
jgi:hypothetical protein